MESLEIEWVLVTYQILQLPTSDFYHVEQVFDPTRRFMC